MQICWVVPDLHAAMDAWTRTSGVGPFFYFDRVEWDNARYRGRAWDNISISAAIAQAGDVQIELMTQNEERASMIREVVPAGRSGLHHMALYCRDFDADLDFYRKAGVEIVFEGLMMGHRVCWLDTVPQLGFMVELITANPTAASIFGQIRAAAENWDGKEPVRRLG
jgi:hypothetical protein